jgi:hypothetical protein
MDRVHESADHNGHGPWLTMATAAEGLVGAHAQGRSGERKLTVSRGKGGGAPGGPRQGLRWLVRW